MSGAGASRIRAKRPEFLRCLKRGGGLFPTPRRSLRGHFPASGACEPFEEQFNRADVRSRAAFTRRRAPRDEGEGPGPGRAGPVGGAFRAPHGRGAQPPAPARAGLRAHYAEAPGSWGGRREGCARSPDRSRRGRGAGRGPAAGARAQAGPPPRPLPFPLPLPGRPPRPLPRPNHAPSSDTRSGPELRIYPSRDLRGVGWLVGAGGGDGKEGAESAVARATGPAQRLGAGGRQEDVSTSAGVLRFD